MLDYTVKKLLYDYIPSNVSIDNNLISITKTFDKTPLNKTILPYVNIKFINEDTDFVRSMDDLISFSDETTSYTSIKMCTIRYTIASTNVNITSTDTIKYITGTNVYQLKNNPVIDVNNVGSYVKNVDYKLSNDHTSIEWLKNYPSNNTSITPNYQWTQLGYYITHQLTDYIMKDVCGRVDNLLTKYNVNIVDVKPVQDISEIYVSDPFTVFTFDVIITYPFKWSITISEEDAIIANTFIFDLYCNNKYINTISYTKP